MLWGFKFLYKIKGFCAKKLQQIPYSNTEERAYVFEVSGLGMNMQEYARGGEWFLFS